jgi:simple sugar transport system permease protein
LLPLLFIAGMIGGALWAILAGLLKTHGKVHEIFGGLGLNFIATALALYLIMGPWRKEGIASTSGTAPFNPTAWLPTFPGGFSVGPVEIVLTIVSLAAVHFLLRGTLWGLQLKAVGNNIRTAFRMGIPTRLLMLGAFALCGLFAGMAGTVQAIGVWHRLIPSISGGYGYLALLVVLLSRFRARGVPFVAFFFSALSKGSVSLPLDLNLDSSLGGVIQGIIVLLFLLISGVRGRLQRHGAMRAS